MKIVLFAGSLRTDSCNKKLAREAARLAKVAGHEVEFLDLKEYPMPVYDGDIETASGLPKETSALSKKIAAADALIIATPEYNGSISSPLKNTLDWLSRDKPMSLTDKHVLLLTASPGALGGIRAAWHTRQPLEAMGVHVYPTMMSLPDAYNAFDEQGNLKQERPLKQLQDLLDKFLKHVAR